MPLFLYTLPLLCNSIFFEMMWVEKGFPLFLPPAPVLLLVALVPVLLLVLPSSLKMRFIILAAAAVLLGVALGSKGHLGARSNDDDEEAPPFEDEAAALAAGKTQDEIDAWKKSHQGPGQVGAGLALNENWGRIRAKAMARQRAQPGGGDMRFAKTFVGKGGGKTAGDMEGEHPKRAGGGAAVVPTTVLLR